MIRLRSTSIRNQIVVLIILMSILPLGIIVYTAVEKQKHETNEAIALTASVANQIQNDQKVLLAGAEQLASAVSILPVVKQRNAAAVNSLLTELVKTNSQVTNIIIVDRTGSLWASAIPSKSALSYTDRRYFKNTVASGRISSGEYSIGKISPFPNLSFAYPIKDHSGAVSDVMAVVISIDRYNQLYNGNYATPASSILLVDHKGTILYSSVDSRLIGKQDRPDLITQMTEGPNEGTFEAEGNLGIRRIFSYRKLWLKGESSPYMYIRTGLDKDFVLAKARKDLMLGAGILLPAMLVMLCVAICFCKSRILNKISALLDATQRIAHGDLTARVPDHNSRGELDELGGAFNVMAQRLLQADDAQEDSGKKLRQSEEMFSAAFHASPDAITLTLLSNGTYLEVNEGYTALTGYQPEEVICKTSIELGIWDNPQDRVQLLRDIQENGIAKSKEFRLRRKDGSIRIGQISVRIIEINGEQCLISVTRDITEREYLQNELLKAQKLESISILAGGIAHNFNNVLTGVIGYISYAKKHLNDPDKVLHILDSAEKSSYRAADLARQLLTFSQGCSPVKSPATVDTLVQESVALFLSGTNVKAVIDCSSHQLIQVDSQQINQAFNNIVLNALQAMPKGGTLTVLTDAVTLKAGNTCSLQPATYVRIVFEDTGHGIAKKDLANVFDPYFTTRECATGLGLSTTQSIISKHGGSIDISSETGQGTTVTIFLPTSAEEYPADEYLHKRVEIDQAGVS